MRISDWSSDVCSSDLFVTLPLVTLSLGFASIDRALVEAAATMGANDRTVFRTVVVPLILPYLVSGYAFAFVLSLNEYRSEEHTSELQSLMRISYAVFCLKKKNKHLQVVPH